MVELGQFFNAHQKLPKLFVLQADEHQVLPNSPVVFAEFDCLFERSHGLYFFAEFDVTAGEIGPRFSLTLIDGNDLGKRLNGLLDLIELHLGAAEHVPGVSMVGVDFGCLLKVLDAFFKIVLVIVVFAKQPRSPYKPFIGRFPSLFVIGEVAHDVPVNAQQLRSLEVGFKHLLRFQFGPVFVSSQVKTLHTLLFHPQARIDLAGTHY